MDNTAASNANTADTANAVGSPRLDETDSPSIGPSPRPRYTATEK
jgi:hypothetical protein